MSSVITKLPQLRVKMQPERQLAANYTCVMWKQQTLLLTGYRETITAPAWTLNTRLDTVRGALRVLWSLGFSERCDWSGEEDLRHMIGARQEVDKMKTLFLHYRTMCRGERSIIERLKCVSK